MLRSVLSPRWILTIVLVSAFAAACFLVLAPWQLGKNDATAHRNALIAQAVETPAVPLDDLQPAGVPLQADNEWREVSIAGRYLGDHEIPMRLRPRAGGTVTEIVTAFQVADDDRIILVNRGSVLPGERADTYDAAPSGPVTIHARLRASEETGTFSQPRIVDDGELVAYRSDTARLSEATGLPLEPFSVQLSPAQPGALGEIELPTLDPGPYLSYGLQWVAFGILAPLGLLYLIVAEIRKRRIAAHTRR